MITEQQYNEAAKLIGTDVASIKAVEEVESARRPGFYSGTKYPITLFEGHVFWKRLTSLGIDPNKYVKGNEDILYPKYDKSKYSGGIRELERLKRAANINKEAAYESASYGKFQIMGFNHKLCGFDNVMDYYNSVSRSEYDQLVAFVRFIINSGMSQSLKDHNFTEFARKYNGPANVEVYSSKLVSSYKKFNNN